MKKIALVLAHPDDAEIWNGGTILNYIDNGYSVEIIYLYVSDQIRIKEANEIMLNYCNIKVSICNTNEQLRNILQRFSPNIIITHWERDSHPQHKETFLRLAGILPELIIEDKLKFNLYSCDTYNSIGMNNLDIFAPSHYVDISKQWERKKELIVKHESQIVKHWISMVERQNLLFGSRTKCDYAEGYLLNYTLGFARVANELLL